MSKPIGKHKDGSNCYTRNCSLDHYSFSSQIAELKTNIDSLFEDKKTSLPSSKTFRSLEYGTEDYNFFRNKAEESESTMTGSEYKAVSEYTGWAYKHYYGFLEGKETDGSPFGSNLDPDLRNKLISSLEHGTSQIDAFISKSGKFPKPVTVFRGERTPKGVSMAEHLAKNYPVGKEVEIKRYLSTSMDPKIASEITGESSDSYVLVIKTKEGVMLGENISEQGLREKEVLLPRDKKYKVTNVSNDTIQWGSTKRNHVTVHLTLCD